MMSDQSGSLATPRNPRYLSLDLWRGLACLMVVVIHSSFYAKADPSPRGPVASAVMLAVSRMGVGVWMFFVISGYCIAATADSSRRKARAPSDYFLRRLRRIFPPYWAMVLITAQTVAIVSALGGSFLVGDENPIPHPASLTAQQWLGNLTLTETWRPHLLGDPFRLQLGPSWTLCYEEQFYAVCGVVLLIAPRRFFAGIAVVTAATLAPTAWMIIRPDAPIDGFFFDGRWLHFAAGVLVYYRVNYASRAGGHLIVLTLALSLGAAAVLRWGVLARGGSWEQKDRAFELIASTAFALLLLLLHPLDGRIARSRPLRPLAFCGTICYSLYLVHWPVTKLLSHASYLGGLRGVWPTVLITFPAAVVISTGLGWVFYLAVERHFLNPPSALGRVPAGAVAVPPSSR